MIDLLFLTNELDYSLDRVVNWLSNNKPEIVVHRINRENVAPLGGMSAVLDQSGWRCRHGPRVAWLRQMLPERDPYGPAPTPAEIDDILVTRRQWLAWTPLLSNVGTRWVNDPFLTYRAESKICQLATAVRTGFDVPRTLVTCELDEAKRFDAEHGPSVVKSITTAFWEFSDQSFVFTTDADTALAADAELWHAQPLFVQERIDGTHDARLFVVGDRVAGACRTRTALDWRREPDVAWVPWTPDEGTVGSAITFMREFDLEYGAFDFILGSKTHEDPVFLECNPSGEFGFLDDVLDGALTRMLGHLLAQLTSSNNCPT